MTVYERLAFKGWLPEAVLSDGAVILWLEPGKPWTKRNCRSTAEALEIQKQRDQREFNP